MTVIPLTANVFPEFNSRYLPPAARESSVRLKTVLRNATRGARRAGLNYAGNVLPDEAWKLFVGGHAHLIDVRTSEERKFTGYVPNTLNIAWPVGPALGESSGFIFSLQNILPTNAVILFLCRSGKRSAAAAVAATQAGFTHVFNVSGGTDGDINSAQDQREYDGWRKRGLPWLRD